MTKGSLTAAVALAGAMALGASGASAQEQKTDEDKFLQQDVIGLVTTSCLEDNKTLAIQSVVAPSATDLDRIAAEKGTARSDLVKAFIEAIGTELDTGLDSVLINYTEDELAQQGGDPDSQFIKDLSAAIDKALKNVEDKTGITPGFGGLQPVGLAPGCQP